MTFWDFAAQHTGEALFMVAFISFGIANLTLVKVTNIKED